jgi:hypothetical protein
LVSACHGGPAVTAVLTGYAYETIPNKTIVAGQTKGPDEANRSEPATTISNPESATLGVLAMGADGLSVWRRESVGSLP